MARLPSPLTVQIAIVVGALATVAFAPPASGRMLLVPLTAQAAAELVPLAVGRGALVLGAGPVPRSYVVHTGRAGALDGVVRRGIIMIAAPPAGCGDGVRAA